MRARESMDGGTAPRPGTNIAARGEPMWEVWDPHPLSVGLQFARSGRGELLYSCAIGFSGLRPRACGFGGHVRDC